MDDKEIRDLVRSFIKDGEVDVKKLLIYALPECLTLAKSEEIAKAEMAAYDKEYKDIFPNRKERYEMLLSYVTENGIQVPREAYDYKVRIQDVLERLDEQMSHEVNEIEEQSNRLLEMNFDEELIDQANEAIFETTELYEKIKNNYVRKNVKRAMMLRKNGRNKN